MSFPMVEIQEHEWKSTIKLKIPKEEGGILGFEDEGGQISKKKNSNYSSRICHVWNKGFSSGKALGGHMRVHLQSAANKVFIKRKRFMNHPNSQIKKQKEDAEDVQEVSSNILTKKDKGIKNQKLPTTCSICGKKFPTMKSLFGHMRCHPDRNWRGIHPPPNNNNNPSSSSSSSSSSDRDDSATSNTTSVDLSKVVVGGGWSVTAKRSRKPDIYRTNSSSEEDQLHDAVNYLMLLAYGDSFASRLTPWTGHKQENPVDMTESKDANLVSKRTIEEPHCSAEKKDYPDDEGSNSKSAAEQQVINSKPSEKADKKAAMAVKMKKIKRRRRKKMKLKDLGSLQDYSFPRAQVVPEINYMSSDSNIFVPIEEQRTEEEAGSNSKLLLESTNGCKINFRAISTVDDQPQVSSSQVSSVGEVRNISGSRILDFDLNELPLPEDEAAGYHGCVSYFSY